MSEQAEGERPPEIRRLTFDDFSQRTTFIRNRVGWPLPVVPLTAVQPGDTQVLAAHPPGTGGGPAIDLDLLAGIASVESVVAGAIVRTATKLPQIRELLLIGEGMPDNATLDRLTSLESFYALRCVSNTRLDLNRLPLHLMRKLAVSRWLANSLEPIAGMNGLEQLELDTFREDLKELAPALAGLTYLRVAGPAKGWAALQECTKLEEAILVDAQLTNLRRFRTWTRLRSLTLCGHGVKCFAGIEALAKLESLRLTNFRSGDLSPLRGMPALTEVIIRMAEPSLDLASLAHVQGLRRLEIDEPVVTDRDILHLPTLKTLGGAAALQEVILMGVAVEDRDLTPLAGLPRLRRVRLGQDIGGDVETLRRARPDLRIEYSPPPPGRERFQERVGQVTIQRPGDGVKLWSIFDNLAQALGVDTNYSAEQKIQRALRRSHPDVLKRIEFDSEAGAVCIYAKEEEDIRRVAALLNEMLAAE